MIYIDKNYTNINIRYDIVLPLRDHPFNLRGGGGGYGFFFGVKIFVFAL